MKKYYLLTILFLLISNISVAAEKIPVTITPAQIISTEYDEVEFGDVVEFKVVKDVFKDETLIIRKEAPVEAEVDYVSPNGWAAETAYIQLKNFKIMNSKNKWIEVPYTLRIKGKDCLKSSNIIYKSCTFLTSLVRGREVNLHPNQKKYNIILLY